MFYDTCKPNTAALDDSWRESFNNIFLDNAGDRLNKNSFFSVELICKVICELKSGKAYLVLIISLLSTLCIVTKLVICL